MMFVQVENLSKSYYKDGGFLKKEKTEILNGIQFFIKKGECLGLIGESGSGKSTLSRMILGLEKPTKGEVKIEGVSVSKWMKNNKGKMSVVFQDYTSSVNPHFTIRNIIAEPLAAWGDSKNLDERINVLLAKVGLPHAVIHKYPHELSGGQLQRVCIARAISTEPEFIVLDEAISSLDVSVQAQILELLRSLQNEMNMTYLFVAHDLQAVANLCDCILFLYRGKIVDRRETIDGYHVRSRSFIFS
ncbi:dipeptide/oligopeptide/nickel ABC transporter ATP-binding protein [Paenibacillus alkaliterrae]|uniref:ABC transporter ATP-binding protein n=1 Tax=Paenibacillus alkaliterrae TaxID=320909 RepID=UPI001F46BE82|nr:dipeptide/oligopeptide/nickel ABC transporter ATP-binding protein [Paenibacillus alkaliterrae]MCF2941479.1 dipeptide/oligopeptide/nickel ABC transporter ATP-binding protein [Paenibacillus alkaliterrae]